MNAVEIRQSDVAKSGGHTARIVHLRGIAVSHGLAHVHEKVNRQVFFFLEQTQDQAVQSEVRLPIQVTEVVTGDVLAVVGKLKAGSSSFRAPFRPELTGEEPLRQNAQILELLEKLVVE